MIVNTDIDIDVANRDKLLKLIRNTPAMISRDGKQVKHNTGVYFHEIPEDPYTGISTVDHKTAEKIGYFKLDILNVNLYDKIESKEQLDTLLDMEPMWDLLEHKDIVEGMFNIHRHYDIVNKMKPQIVNHSNHSLGKESTNVCLRQENSMVLLFSLKIFTNSLAL